MLEFVAISYVSLKLIATGIHRMICKQWLDLIGMHSLDVIVHSCTILQDRVLTRPHSLITQNRSNTASKSVSVSRD
jgi:hypothetical protein